jgi:hypothetical protein
MPSLESKREAAINYLRSRGKYIVDPSCHFKPTNAAQTDIAKTIEQYRRDVSEEPMVQLISGRKREAK